MANPFDDPVNPSDMPPSGARLRRQIPVAAPHAAETSPLRPLRVSPSEERELKKIVESVYSEYGVPISPDDPVLGLVPIVMRVADMLRSTTDRNLDNIRNQVGDQISHLLTRTSDLISSEYQRQNEAQKTAVDTGVMIGNKIVEHVGRRSEQQLQAFIAQLRSTLTDVLAPVLEQKAYVARIERAARRIVVATTIFVIALISGLIVYGVVRPHG